MTTLQCLRIYGPITIPEIVSRTGYFSGVVEDNLKTFVEYGIAKDYGPFGFDVTDEGRRLFSQGLRRGVTNLSIAKCWLRRRVG